MALPDAKHRLNQVEAIIETYQFDSMHFPIEFRSISLRYSRFLLVATPAACSLLNVQATSEHTVLPLVVLSCINIRNIAARTNETFLSRIRAIASRCSANRISRCICARYVDVFFVSHLMTYHFVSAIPIMLLKVYSRWASWCFFIHLYLWDIFLLLHVFQSDSIWIGTQEIWK